MGLYRKKIDLHAQKAGAFRTPSLFLPEVNTRHICLGTAQVNCFRQKRKKIQDDKSPQILCCVISTSLYYISLSFGL